MYVRVNTKVKKLCGCPHRKEKNKRDEREKKKKKRAEKSRQLDLDAKASENVVQFAQCEHSDFSWLRCLKSLQYQRLAPLDLVCFPDRRFAKHTLDVFGLLIAMHHMSMGIGPLVLQTPGTKTRPASTCNCTAVQKILKCEPTSGALQHQNFLDNFDLKNFAVLLDLIFDGQDALVLSSHAFLGVCGDTSGCCFDAVHQNLILQLFDEVSRRLEGIDVAHRKTVLA